MGVIFKLKGSVRDTDFSPNINTDLFDKLMRPIALYASEIWGARHTKGRRSLKAILKSYSINMGKAESLDLQIRLRGPQKRSK